MEPLEFRAFNYATTDEPGGARLYSGDAWLGTVWRYVCGWSWCLVIHPAKIGGACNNFEDGCRTLVAEYWKHHAAQGEAP